MPWCCKACMDCAGAYTPLTEPQPRLTINHPAINPPCSSSSQLENMVKHIHVAVTVSWDSLAYDLAQASLQVTQRPSHRTLHLKRVFPVCLLEQAYGWHWAEEPPLSLLSLIFRISRSKLIIRIVAETICMSDPDTCSSTAPHSYKGCWHTEGTAVYEMRLSKIVKYPAPIDFMAPLYYGDNV